MRNSNIRNPQSAIRNSLSAWCELLRLPNLLTVPGDPLAGFLLAAAWRRWPNYLPLAPAIAASLCLYAFGLILNDLCDLAEDRRERPSRPLPRGAISRRAAWAAACVLAVLGLGAAALTQQWTAMLMALVLLAAIVAYDAGAKRVPILGPLVMGLCRALSLLLGAAALGANALTLPTVILAGCLLGAYVAAVTSIASRETRGGPVGWRGNAPACLLAFWLSLMLLLVGKGLFASAQSIVFAATAIGAIAWAMSSAVALGAAVQPAQVQRQIGRLIRGLLLLQAMFAALTPAWWFAAPALAILMLPAALAGRKFHAS